MSAKHLLAARRGIQPSDPGCTCMVCGPSPFAASAATLGPNFTAFGALAAPDASVICAGCADLLAGRPGNDPPPVRTTSVIADESGFRAVTNREIGDLLLAPPAGQFVVSWSKSRQVHHWLYAGVSTRDRMEIGSDAGTIDYVPSRDGGVTAAVAALLYAPTGTQPLLSRTSVLTGDYHPSALAKFGHDEWQRCESVVARCRPSLLLDLLTSCIPTTTSRATAAENPMIDEDDKLATDLLAAIAFASSVRAQDGKQFWAGFFRHRVERFRRLPLATMASRLLSECRCPTSLAVGASSLLESWTIEESARVEQAIRERPDLLIALAYDELARRKQQRCG